MGGSMTKIIPQLYLGSLRNAEDEEEITRHGITHILTVHDLRKELIKVPHREYLRITASDNHQQNLSQYFSQTNTFIHKARMEGGTCLVHCMAGISRSATVCLAYIMAVTGMPFRDVLNAMRGLRHSVNPNFNFQAQLLKYQKESLATAEGMRLEEKFGPWPGRDKDIVDLEKGLATHKQFVVTGVYPINDPNTYPFDHNAYDRIDKDGGASANEKSTKKKASTAYTVTHNNYRDFSDAVLLDGVCPVSSSLSNQEFHELRTETDTQTNYETVDCVSKLFRDKSV